MLLLARTSPLNEGNKKTDGLSVFLLDMQEAKKKGLTIKPIKTMMNHATTEVFFDNLRIPKSSLIGEEGKGFKYILSGMNAERILIAAECIGDSKWFTNKSTNYKRKAYFWKTNRTNKVYNSYKIVCEFKSSRTYGYHAAKLYDNGESIGEEANTSKLLAAEASWVAVEACIQTHGGFCLLRNTI